MNHHYIPLIIIVLLVTLSGCAVTPSPAPRQDPLIGRIIDSGSSRPVAFDGLVEAIRDKDVIYLSEKHNNPGHHAAQERVIKDLVGQGLAPFIGFEFFAMDDTPLLLNFIDSKHAKHSAKVDKQMEQILRKKLGWDDQSDEMWAYYYRLLLLAREHQLGVAGLDLSEAQKRRITRKGIDALSELEKARLYSTDLDNPIYRDYMHDIFRQAHCGMDSPRMQARLYDAWLARNDKMALSITEVRKTHDKGPVIVIVGGGHTEYNLGVIDRVKSIAPHLSQVNVGLVEINVREKNLPQYLEPLDLEGFEPVPPYDYLWFFQRVSYENPCERFKESLKRMKRKK